MNIIEQMLLNNKNNKDNGRKILSDKERVCSGVGCGVVLKLEDLPDSQRRWKKFQCIDCERKRKERYRKSNRTKTNNEEL